MTRNECNLLTEEMKGLLERSKIKNWHDNDALTFKDLFTHQMMNKEMVKRLFTYNPYGSNYIKSYNNVLDVSIKNLGYEDSGREFKIRISIKFSYQLYCENYIYKNFYSKMQEGIRMFIDDATQCIIH